MKIIDALTQKLQRQGNSTTSIYHARPIGSIQRAGIMLGHHRSQLTVVRKQVFSSQRPYQRTRTTTFYFGKRALVIPAHAKGSKNDLPQHCCNSGTSTLTTPTLAC